MPSVEEIIKSTPELCFSNYYRKQPNLRLQGFLTSSNAEWALKSIPIESCASVCSLYECCSGKISLKKTCRLSTNSSFVDYSQPSRYCIKDLEFKFSK